MIAILLAAKLVISATENPDGFSHRDPEARRNSFVGISPLPPQGGQGGEAQEQDCSVPLCLRGFLQEACGRCGTALKTGTKFCTRCGTKAEPRTCLRCEAKADPADRFCGQCGTMLVQPEEYVQGMKCLENRDFEKAIQWFTKYLVEYQFHPSGFAARARAHLGLGQIDKALEDATRAVYLGPDDPPVYEIRAEVRMETGHDGALQDLERALTLDPRRIPALRLRAKFYVNRAQAAIDAGRDPRQDLEKALADTQRAIDLDAKNAVAWLARARIRLLVARAENAKGQDATPSIASALVDFDRAIELDSRSAPALVGRAECWMLASEVRRRLGKDPAEALQKAVEDATRAVAVDPAFAPTWVLRGHARAVLGDNSGALADLNEAIRLDPKLKDQLQPTLDKLKKP